METLTLTELGSRLARRWRTLLAGTLVGAALGVVVVLVAPTRFEATTVVHVDAADPARVDMAAEQAVATSRRVTAEALDALGDDRLTIDRLEAAASAVAVKDSRLLRITYGSPRPADATSGADALAEAYLAVRVVDARQGVDGPAVDATVVDPARTPTSPVGPPAAATLLGTVVLGLLGASALAGSSASGVSRSAGGPAS